MGAAKWAMTAFAAVAAYLVLIAVVGFENISPAINFVRLAGAVTVVVVYAPVLLSLFKSKEKTSRDLLILGVILTWTSTVGLAMWAWIGLGFGLPTTILTSPVTAFFAVVMVAGAACHLGALVDVRDGDRRRTFRRIALSILFGAIVAATVIATSGILQRQ